MLTVGKEGSALIDIDVGSEIKAVAFTVDGEHIVGGGDGQVGVWRVTDGKEVGTMDARDVWCLAVAQDGRWIAGGTFDGHAFVWDAKTFEKVLTHWVDPDDILAVDFSPDSTRLLVASFNRTAAIWDVAAREQVLTLPHDSPVIAAKYSPQGDRIAVATDKSVRVWDSSDRRVLVDIAVNVVPLFNTGLLWSNNHLFVISGSTIRQFDASTGSAAAKWPVHQSNPLSCIARPQHRDFIAYSTNDTVMCWHASTHVQLCRIQHPQDISSIALSPDDRLLAIGGHGGKITIRCLYPIPVSIMFLWVLVDLNSFLVPLVFPNRIQSNWRVYIPLSRNLTFRSTTLRSIHGSTISSRMRTRY